MYKCICFTNTILNAHVIYLCIFLFYPISCFTYVYYYLLLVMCMCVYMSPDTHRGQRSWPGSPWNRNYRQLQAAWHGYWKPNLVLLQEQRVLIGPELSLLQPRLHLFSWGSCLPHDVSSAWTFLSPWFTFSVSSKITVRKLTTTTTTPEQNPSSPAVSEIFTLYLL